METKENGQEYCLLKPLRRLCRVAAFNLHRILTKGTDESRMIQEKKKGKQMHANCEWAGVTEYIGTVREKTHAGHTVGHTGDGARILGILTGHER